jgi:hypothetical protein
LFYLKKKNATFLLQIGENLKNIRISFTPGGYLDELTQLLGFQICRWLAEVQKPRDDVIIFDAHRKITRH